MFSYLVLALLLSEPGVSIDALVHQALEDLKAERYVEARQKLEKVVKVVPDNAALWSYLGLAHSRLNEIDSAIAAFQKALSNSPKDALTYFNLGLLYWRKGDVGKALDVYQKGLKLNQTDVAANENYALLLMGTGKYKEAIEPLRRAKAENSSGLSVRVALIESLLKGGMKTEGERETKELLQSQIASPQEKVKLAVLLVEHKQLDIAEDVLKNALASSPELADAHGLLGMLHLEKNLHEDAVRELGRAVQLDPDSAKYSMGLAQALYMWKHYSPAIAFLEAVEDRFGKLPEFRYKLALAHYGSRQFPKAIVEFEKLLNQQPPRMDLVQYHLANSYLATGEFTKAEFCYKRAIEANPKDPSIYLSLAALLRKQSIDRIDEAVQNLQKAMKLEPSDPRPKLQLALCYETTKELAKAQALLEEVVRSQPDLIPAHVALARVYYGAGKNAEGGREKTIIAGLEAEEQKRQSRPAISTANDPPRAVNETGPR